MCSAKLLQAATGDYSEAVGQSTLCDPAFTDLRAEWSTAGAGTCTHFSKSLGYHGSVCSCLLLHMWVQGEGEIQIQLE